MYIRYVYTEYINDLLLHLGTGADHCPFLQVIVVCPISWALADGMNVTVLPSVSPPRNAVVPHDIVPGCSQNTVTR